jgi:sulfoxide reductase heme-binding subunit YedZ
MRVVLSRWLSRPWAKPVWFLVSTVPALWLAWAAANDLLGANPAEALIRSSGDWALRALCVVLAITPVRVVLQVPTLARMRRMAGLFVYFYVALHFVAYAWLDMGFEWSDIAKDIAKRPFILVGFSAFVVLTPLALTSFNRAIRTLGGKRWQLLHRAVHAVAGLAILHFFWMRAGKNNFAEVAVYGLILSVLLGWRLSRRLQRS